MKNLIKKMSIFKSSKVKLSQFSDKLRKKIPWKRKNITSQRIQILFIKIRGGADLTSIKGRLRSSILFLTKKSRGGLIYIILYVSRLPLRTVSIIIVLINYLAVAKLCCYFKSLAPYAISSTISFCLIFIVCKGIYCEGEGDNIKIKFNTTKLVMFFVWMLCFVEHTITLNPTYLNEGCPPKIYIERVESQRQFLPQEIEKIGNILRPADPFKLHEFGEKSKIAELKVKFEENNQKNISQDISQDIPQDISQNISKMMEATMLGEEESTPILIKGPQKAKVSRTPRKMRKRVQTLTDLTANDDPSNSSKNEEFNDITDSANLNEFKKIMEDPVQ